MKYKCIAKCPELDCDNIPHCKFETDNECEALELKNRECPCGNEPNWKEEN